jgi:hypothetical protein
VNTLLGEYIIIPTQEDLLRKALNSNFSDFEDAVHIFVQKR